jgi:FKBP-type peptidyl-prolyl cis-trans isomerase FklB
MRFFIVALALMIGVTGAVQAQQKKVSKAKGAVATVAAEADAPMVLASTRDSLSYALGMNIGMNLKMQNFDIDPAILAKALAGRYEDKATVLSEEQAMNLIMAYQQKAQEKQQAEQAVAGEKNKAEGEAFLAENKKREGVKVTESGLQYEVIKMGEGPKPTKDDKVRTHYHGTLISGKVFDSSKQRGEAVEFPVSGVIPGWIEALQMMPVGSQWKLYIPSNLAYGERGVSADIGPNTVLIFEIDLIDIVK